MLHLKTFTVVKKKQTARRIKKIFGVSTKLQTLIKIKY